ncbi:hypothetical protein TMS3_0120200 [Pseudomonas taeanensis MS-3]|uniref:Uncharacterized protein n=2 Tax=Pseudomonas taeanensis TaxID=574962 RepID=A0A0A1YEE2_9PSED|nr:hypothetical protein TMS3_0120200 [Pseudomonas taeanensis MS-3]
MGSEAYPNTAMTFEQLKRQDEALRRIAELARGRGLVAHGTRYADKKPCPSCKPCTTGYG